VNREFTFDVDVSNLPCGLNGALYFSQMSSDGDKGGHNQAGAKYGTGYCDAQCPHDMKFIKGSANAEGWKPSSSDPNSGTGKFGSCCQEMDIWEANSQSQAYTLHPCSINEPGAHRCEGEDCGDNPDHRYDGVCDKDGCDFATYRFGDHSFYGMGDSFKVDTSRKFTVVTQFLTRDN
jgi:cellulose 1,4-beta-cellobiosidase